MKILNMVIPILMHLLIFIRQKHIILHQNVSSPAMYNHDANQSQAMLLMMSGLRRYIAECTVANSWRYPVRRRVIFASALEWKNQISSIYLMT